jgi:hypothetical protein
MVIFIVNLRAAGAIVTIEYISCDDLVTALSVHAANLARSGLQSRATWRPIDTISQIRLFVKLKLASCAPIMGFPRSGFFMSAARQARLAALELASGCFEVYKLSACEAAAYWPGSPVLFSCC